MKKINSSEDSQDDLDNFRKKKLKTGVVTDQMVPTPESSPLRKEEEDRDEIKRENNAKTVEILSLQGKQYDEENLEQEKSISESEDLGSPHSQEGDVPESYGAEDAAGSYDVGDVPSSYIVEDAAANYEIEDSHTPYDLNNVSVNYDELDTPASYIIGDSSLPSPEAALDHKEMSPLTESVSTICANASVEEDLDEGDADDHEDEVERDTEVIGYSTEESANDMESNQNFTGTQGERGVIPEVEDVTCDSGGETMLIRKQEVCSNECEVGKSNVCVEEEMAYRDHLNSIESLDEVMFHSRSTIIDTGGSSVSLHTGDNSVVKYRDGHLVCELPGRETEGIVQYSDGYGEIGIGAVFPKRICSNMHATAPAPDPSESELYVYDSSVQNMVLCRNSTIIDQSTVPVNPGLHRLESYSFHRVPVESSSNIKNINDNYSHATSEICPILQDQNFVTDNRSKAVKKLPSDEDFMRRIEKTLFESKIENKIDDAIDSKYKAESDLSLPLKKRIRTLASISNITCTTEKFVSPKEESFPSYPTKPMISIAELEFTKGLLPKPGITYQDNYK